MIRRVLARMLCAAALVACVAAADLAGQERRPRLTSLFDIPDELQREHEELLRELAAATRIPGETGRAAQRVAKLLNGHFDDEEEFALPPLALLRRLAAGEIIPQMREAVAMADKMKAELPRMLQEHQAVVGALGALTYAAQEERHRDVVAFAERLKRHAQHEEQILYPTAILVGELLKLKLPSE